MNEHISPASKIYLADSSILNAGRGIFAAADISKHEVIETCPVLELPAVDYEHLQATQLHNYYFLWGGKSIKQAVICLGFGSLYNHSWTPNATYKKDPDRQTITFIAIKSILRGEEITVNYNYGNPDDKSKLWIEDIPDADGKS